MTNIAKLAGTSALIAALAVPAFAQTEVATGANASGVGAINTQITDVEKSVRDDFARSNDSQRFGPGHNRQGLFGSVALSYVGRSGNIENQDFSLAGRMNWNQGQWAQSVGLLLEYGESDTGRTDTKNTSVIYDGNYYFNDKVYAFALGRVTTDGLANDFDGLTADEISKRQGRLKRDAFLGFGPGYRVINNENTAWRVQAGVGVRYTQTVDLSASDNLKSETGTGYIVSSRFYHKFNDTFFVTNDTDLLSSKSNDVATNELGLNYKMTDAMATRVSYKTEYVSDRDIRTDNKLGVSLVFGF